LQTIRPTASFQDFMYDIQHNLCLVYLDGGKYQFIHRSIQEYFAALFICNSFSTAAQDEKQALSDYLIDIFENKGIDGTAVLGMLHDMAPEKMNEYVLIPYLDNLFAECEKSGSNEIIAFIGKMYPDLRLWYEYNECIEYDEDTGEKVDESYYDFSIDNYSSLNANLLNFIVRNLLAFEPEETTESDVWPYEFDDVKERVPLIVGEIEKMEAEERDTCTAFTSDTVEYDPSIRPSDICIYSDFTYVNGNNTFSDGYHFNITHILTKTDRYPNLIWVLNHDEFPFKKVCETLYPLVQNYLRTLKATQKSKNEVLPGFFKPKAGNNNDS